MNDPRRIDRVAAAWRELINALGYDPSDPHLVDSPARVARFLAEWHTVHAEPPKLTTFPNDGNYNDLVLTKDIRFHSMCAHHGLPFFGVAAVAYIPDARILGLSKLARVVDYYSRRFQTQESITQSVADLLEKELAPKGVAVVLSGEHLCMSMRGISRPGHQTVTSAMRGAFFHNQAARAEILALVGGSK